MVIDLIVSYTSVLAGIILSIISPEELKPGRKYFRVLQLLLFGLVLLVPLYIIVIERRFFLFAGVLIASLFLFWIRIKQSVLWTEVLHYLFFTGLFFFVSASSYRLLFLSLLFLYGLPTGTLFRLQLIERQEKKTVLSS